MKSFVVFLLSVGFMYPLLAQLPDGIKTVSEDGSGITLNLIFGEVHCHAHTAFALHTQHNKLSTHLHSLSIIPGIL